MSTHSSLTTTYDNIQYDVYFTLYGDDNNISKVAANAIVSIRIFENLFDPFFSVEIEYTDDAHALEKGSNIESSAVMEDIFTKYGYRYRGDGHDVVQLEITPHGDDSEISSFCCILNVIGAYRKFNESTKQYTKVLQLCDYTKQIFLEHQSFFSTANNINTVSNTAQLSNEQRMMTTGAALAKLIDDTLDGKRQTRINTSAWDIGGSKIFYSAGVNEKGLTTLQNLYKLHISADNHLNDNCYLSHDISSSNLWSLVNLGTYYNSAIKTNGVQKLMGSAHIGRIKLEASSDTLPGPSKYTLADLIINTANDNALSYDFKDIQAQDAINLNSHIVYNYKLNDKEFIVDMFDGDITKFKESFFKNYISKMVGKNDKPYPNIPLTTSKITNKTITNVFNLYDSNNLYCGKNILLNIANLLNNGIEVTTVGNTVRRPGLFINIDNTDANLINDFNNKIYGDYLIIATEHVFQNNHYTTTLICTKPYVYCQPKNKPEGLING